MICWNAYLMYRVNKLESRSDTDSNLTIVNKTVTGFSTDLTKVVEESESKVVGISSYFNGRLIMVGSGFVYRSDQGVILIVTNDHVIENANSISVMFDNGEELQAEVVGYDKMTDLALLQVNADFHVNAFNFSDSSLCKKGEWVIAMGSPFGLDLQNTVSVGVISGIDRYVEMDLNGDQEADWDMLFLQTDAAINQGNSGGPLMNMEGDLVGMITMKMTGQYSDGIGFATPSNEIVSIVEQLLEKGTVIRPVIGMSLWDVQKMTVYQKSHLNINLDIVQGLLVHGLTEELPAKKAGMQLNDILIRIDNVKVEDLKQYRKVLYSKNPGESVEITILRDDREMKVIVVLE